MKMKKILTAAVIAAFALGALALTSCNKDKGKTSYYWYYIVKNESSREIVVSPYYDDSEEGLRSITLSPGNTRIVYDTYDFITSNNMLVEDTYGDDDMVPTHYSPYDNYYNYYYGDDGHWFSMTAGGEEVPKEIWMRKYWTFTPRYVSWTYTLTVTDELLTEVGPAVAE